MSRLEQYYQETFPDGIEFESLSPDLRAKLENSIDYASWKFSKSMDNLTEKLRELRESIDVFAKEASKTIDELRDD